VEAAAKSLRLVPGADRDDLEQDAAVRVIRAMATERTDDYLFITARNRMLSMLRSHECHLRTALDPGEVGHAIYARIDELAERWRAAVREECAEVAGDDWGQVGGVLLGDDEPNEVAERIGAKPLDVWRRVCAVKKRISRSPRMKNLYLASL
jgi:DNA-directed RNA polymerase specialized sigma24 family protein